MIEATLREVVEAYPVLEKVGQEKLPPKAAWRVARLLAKLRSEHRDYSKVRLEAFKKYGESEDGGQTYTVPLEKHAALNEELEQVLAENVKIDYEPIPLELFGESHLAPADLVVLERFVKE